MFFSGQALLPSARASTETHAHRVLVSAGSNPGAYSRLWEGFCAFHNSTRREQIVAQNAFYMGARITLKVLNRTIEIDESDEALKTIKRHARTIKTLQGLKPRARRH
jgi:hypothetical protein